MSVLPEHLGPWIQISHVLRFTKDDPVNDKGEKREDKLSERPRAGRRGNWMHFLDNPDANHGDTPGPTLVTFEADDTLDVPALLRQGAIRLPTAKQLPPKTKPSKEVT